jgi:hypothetical protein
MNLQKSQFLLLLVATGALAAGCGSGGGSSASSGSPVAGTSIAKARAVAYADAINLGGADVPGATIVKSEGEAKAPTLAGVELARCTGGVSPELRIVNIHSPAFRVASASERGRVRSAVEVMPSAALAARNNAAARSARGRSCLARFLARALPEQSTGPLRHGPVSISSLPNSLPGADGSFGLRLATTAIGRNLRGGQILTRVYTDVFGFVSGPAEINLTATGLPRPVPSATEQRLLSLLFGRAQEHKL